MKRLLLLSLFFLSAKSYGQEDQSSLSAFKQGSTTVGLSAGFGVNQTALGLAGAKDYPLFGIIFDRSTIDNVGPGAIGFGCIAGLKVSTYEAANLYTTMQFDVIAAFRATYHLTILKEINNHFDPYAGVMLGVRQSFYDHTSFSNNGHSYKPEPKTRFARGVFAGAKYNFTRGFGVFAEAAVDVSNFRVGINFNTLNK